MAILFWMLRLIGAFAVVTCVFLSWRTSLVLAACLCVDFLAMLAGTMMTASFWTQAQLLFLTGVLLGFVELGRRQQSTWDYPVLSFGVLLLLTASWMVDTTDVRELISNWPLMVSRVLALPLGLWGMSAAIRAVQRARTPSRAGSA